MTTWLLDLFSVQNQNSSFFLPKTSKYIVIRHKSLLVGWQHLLFIWPRLQRRTSDAKAYNATTDSERENISTTVPVDWNLPATHVVIENDETESPNETGGKTDRRQRLRRTKRSRPPQVFCTSPRVDRWTDGCCTSIFFCVISLFRQQVSSFTLAVEQMKLVSPSPTTESRKCDIGSMHCCCCCKARLWSFLADQIAGHSDLMLLLLNVPS